MPEDLDDVEQEIRYINDIKERNRKLHYQKAVIGRIERENRKRRIWLLALLFPMLSIMTSLSLILIEKNIYVEKSFIQSDIKNIIKNGGDLPAIKQAFNSQLTVNQIKVIFSNKSAYYNENTPLSVVLTDIRVNAFRDADKAILPLIEPIIAEYDEINPFDKLQIGQKDYFENIRIKSGTDYVSIFNDVNNLADELHKKNMLVEEYLGDSKMSFWISIIAVFLSLLIGGYQIFSARPEAMKKLLLAAMDENSDSRVKNTKNAFK